MQKQMTRYLSLLLIVALLTSIFLSAIPVAYAAPATIATAYTDSVLQAFQNPNHREKPMVRLWFPDAAAGIDPYDNVEKTIQELANAGFGGVELALLTDGVDYNNPELEVIGWGTPAWKETVKKVLRAANAIPGGFVVDITVTPHWPAIVNAIDPNDDAAMRETVRTYQKLTNATLDAGTIQLLLPDEKTNSTAGSGIATPAYFIYISKHVSTALAKVSAVNAQGVPTSYDFDSMIFVDGDVSPLAKGVGGWAAGVPDETEFNRRKALNLPATSISPSMAAMTYQTHVVDVFGPEPATGADLSVSYNGKQDENCNRARMQDWQYEYELALTNETKTTIGSYTASAGANCAVGDWVVLNVYDRGTGQTTSGPPSIVAPEMMYNRTYVTNYLSATGINALLDAWNKKVLDDEMVALLRANGNSSIFDDSLEIRASSGSSFWTHEIGPELSGKNYLWKNQFPFVVAFGSGSFATTANTGVPARIVQDYNLLLGNLYNVGHCQVIEDWAQGFGYNFRSQCYTMTGVDIPLSATHCIPEGDNGCKGDGLRQLSSVVNMFDKPVLSMEAVTVSGGNLKITWADAITEVAQNYSNGVNRVILHGAPYSKSFNGYFGGWPGWQAFGTAYGDGYSYKQTYWEDANTMTGYFARNQAVLQKGQAKVDLLVLRDQSSVFSNGSGNGFQTLLDNGYSYNLTSEGVIKLNEVSVSNGVICEDGPAYKALILNSVSNISAPAMQKILSMAQAGLPVIIYGTSVPSTVYGTDSTGNNTTAMLGFYSQLTALSNVYTAANQNALLTTLEGINITPAASYNVARMQASRYVDKTTGTSYYYMFNDVRNGASGMLNNNNTPNATWKNGAAVAGTVTLTGDGVPCLLDAWTGEIDPVAVYTDNGDGTVSFYVSLSGGESKLYAVLPLTEEISSVKAVSAGAEIVRTESGLALRASAPGTYDITRNDGTILPVTVASVPAAINLNSGWNLKLESWGPDDSAANKQVPIAGIPYSPIYLTYNRSAFDSSGKTGYDGIWKDPSATIKTDINFNNIALMNWANLPATSQQLLNIGVGSMANVSGIGYYTNTFTLPGDWKNAGAILNLGYGRDSVTRVTVNGHIFDNINNVTDKLDIGAYLLAGRLNTIEIKVASVLFNRARLTNMADMRATGTQATLTANGLTSVQLVPYAQVSLAYTINATAGAGGRAIGGGAYGEGETVTLTATASSGFSFVGWYEGVNRVSTDAVYTFTATANRSLQARFASDGSFASDFANPPSDYKPMVRYWWPSAPQDLDELEAEIREIAAAGYGGIEIASVADSSGWVDPVEWGWGGANWNKALIRALQTAKDVGIKVDLTVGPHWPMSIPGVNPNTPDSAKMLVAVTTNVTAGGTFSGAAPAPPAATYNMPNGPTQADMVQKNYDFELMYASAAKVNGGVYDIDSMTPVDVGPGDTIDWNNTTADDYVLFTYWMRGTGQRGQSGQNPTYQLSDPVPYTVDHFSLAGTNAFINYWKSDILTPEVLALLKDVGGSFFEDSLELSGSQWTAEFAEYFEEHRGYDVTPYINMILNANLSVNDNELKARIREDYSQTMNDMYIDFHIKPMMEFMNSYGMTFRTQSYGGAVDSSQTASIVDIIEGELLTFSGMAVTIEGAENGANVAGEWTVNNKFRMLRGGANLGTANILSDEIGSLLGADYGLTMTLLNSLMNNDMSAGVNNMVVHGYPYLYAPNTMWPSYATFSPMNFRGAGFGVSLNHYTPQWKSWDQVLTYLHRNQYILQQGNSKVDVAIFRHELSTNGKTISDGTLVDKGFTYDYVSPNAFDNPKAYVSSGIFAPDGPGYKAMVVLDAEYITLDGADKLLEYADGGLPIILVKQIPSKVKGFGDRNRDADIAAKMVTLLEKTNVTFIANETDLTDTLLGMGVKPAASFGQSEKNLSTVRRTDGSVNYYYLFNRSYTSSLEVDVTLDGIGTPYLMNAYSGEIARLAQYTALPGAIKTTIKLTPRDTMLIAIGGDDWYSDGNSALPYITNADADGRFDANGLSLVTTQSGTYTASLSDGADKTFVVDVPDSVVLENWHLSLESWLPVNPRRSSTTGFDREAYATKYEYIERDLNGIVPWNQISGMEDAVGIGTYTTTVTLNTAWTGGYNAFLDLVDVGDIYELYVNGVKLPANQVSFVTDIGGYLQKGANQIEVKVTSPMINAMRVIFPDALVAGSTLVYGSRTPTNNGLRANPVLIPYGVANMDSIEIIATAGTGGTVAGGGLYLPGTLVTLTASVGANYSFEGWYEATVKVSATATYTFTADVERTLEARFTYSPPSIPPVSGGTTYSITATAGPNGTITPASALAAEGTNRTFTITPDEGYVVDDVLVDGVSVGARTSYTFFNIQATHTIRATFAEEEDITTPPPPLGIFIDVPDNAWYFDAVYFTYDLGIFKGTSTNMFSPDMNLTRGMFVTVLGRLAELQGDNTVGFTNPFGDVAAGQYYTPYVAWAAAHGIVLGYNATTFGPNDPITREQMAVIFTRFADYMGIELDDDNAKTFSDAGSISDYAKVPVERAVAAGLMQGDPGGTFRPLATATRAEVAQIFKNLVEAYLS